MDVDKKKAALRERAKEVRKKSSKCARGDVPNTLAEAMLSLSSVLGLKDKNTRISAYWPIDNEIDTRPLMTRLHNYGHSIFLPVVQNLKSPLVFRRWHPSLNLVIGEFGIQVPGVGEETGIPSILIIPLLAFDEAGFRLGYGGGFYDRTLASFRSSENMVIAIGVGYEAQFVPNLPIDKYDEKLDFIVTEKKVRCFG